ncbi:hypothetical protein N7532_003501 [Penicillium argentinense]|uniref:Zn(2)-C6 fungal-type domain-containing protein n=1 Tax=Penicillium argentinense TaxID=1131581 RepID=A0A9W9FMN1_9EURO|nr:uncharacterized protein N7532_003501 [Penicillium argentinense]KAJ5102972.1 hypothetical protein N7532_003501 [Penicillium argentinense]
MSSRRKSAKIDTPHRRKIALACESCRDKKVRCNGEKPICGPCARRGYPIDRCVYKIDNARSASNDVYLKVLHNRIRELEDICARNGVAIPPRNTDERDSDRAEERQMRIDTMDHESRTSVAVEGLLGLGSHAALLGQLHPPMTRGGSRATPPNHRPSIQSSHSNLGHAESESPHRNIIPYEAAQPPSANTYASPSINSHGNVTAMGAISVGEDGESNESPREQYYGNSSVASFMRLAKDSMPIRSYLQTLKRMEGDTPSGSYRDMGLWRDCLTPTLGLQFDDFSLPPRSLADHLLECYWDRVHCLYPFFHRPSFEQAYENLWGSSKWPKPQLPELNIGLGGSFDSGHQSIVFHCALNAIFGLSCHFSDIPAAEREAAAYSFFLRSKRFVGLDLLDIGTIGVVQTLLIISLLLQSTPYPNRCWNAIGLACRVAQGLGLHETASQQSIKPLEQEVRHRTWHGCVIMDMIVSMTYGRPSMTSHISPAPPPVMKPNLASEDPCALSGQPCDHKSGYMTFYVCTIELYKILESILSDIYNAWQSRSSHHRPMSHRGMNHSSLDVIMELDDKLCTYEANIPPVLNWTNMNPPLSPQSTQDSIFKRQRNVLRARFIHLRLLLYRPMFTQLCSDERMGFTRQTGLDSDRNTIGLEKNVIYNSMSVSCAAACVRAAMELVSHVYATYRTSLTDAWWYNGFYTSTAGFVLIMSYSCRSILDQIDVHAVDDTWRKCEEVLTYMSSFSLSARNSLQFLQVTHQHIVQNYTGGSRNDDNTLAPSQLQRSSRNTDRSDMTSEPPEGIAEEPGSRDSESNGPAVNPFMSWDEMGLGQEELGFLGRFDLPDLASWFSDVPDVLS